MLATVGKLDSVYFFGDSVVLVSPEYMLAKIMPSWTEFQGLDKVANLSTLTAGALGVAGGFPIVMTSFITADLNASGVFDNSVKDYTGMLVVNRARYRMGIRRALTVEQARDIDRGINSIVGTMRGLFYEYPPAALGEKNVAYSYKLAKS
jgi:hypothetical protein